jgi:uncharacterized protein
LKLWIDALTPKQAFFAKALVGGAPSKFKCTVTTRKYLELDGVLKQIKLQSRPIGMHGGKAPSDKLKASLERQLELFRFAAENDFDCSLSFISPEAARVSFGLGLGHYICSDSPHAEAACRLAVPLAAELFFPFPIRAERWMRYGLERNQLFPYHALDPWVWISRMRLRHTKARVVVIRLEESFASYFRSGMGLSDSLDRLIQVIPSEFQIVLVPRYSVQRRWALEKFGKKCTVAMSALDGPALVSSASLVIGGGGTMTQEAALLGVPNISYFPSAKLDVFENFYFPKKLSKKATTQGELVKVTKTTLENIESEQRDFSDRAKSEEKRFEDPVKFIFTRLSNSHTK